MSFMSIIKQILEVLIDIILILYYVLKSIILLFIPRSYRFKSVNNKIILITGGGRGIGRALAIGFAKYGAIIVILDINSNGLEKTAKIIKSLKGTVYSYCCDITDRNCVYEMADRVVQEVGAVDMLVNNAGIVSGKDFLNIPDEMIVQTFNVNVLSHFWLLKAFLPNMMRKNSGHLVTLASIAGLVGVSGLTDYCGSKFAAIGFEESVRKELLRDGYDGIKSTIVCPYFINTGLFSGVNSTVLPILETDYVSQQIIKAVLSDQNMIILPKIMYAMPVLKTILPFDAFEKVYKIFGGYQMMTNEFVGRYRRKLSCDQNHN